MSDGTSEVIVERGVEIPTPRAGEVWTVGAVILNERNEAFAQLRSAERRLFPCTWDIVGGHVEPGETLLAALAREVHEETGWRLRRLCRLLRVATWEGDDGRGPRHEADYVVEVSGDLAHPMLEWSKNTAYGWFGPGDLARLMENRPTELDTYVRDVVADALRIA
jgi:8-oxo-dGTP pyrophosphatase MutT (NUDIX family)